MFTRNLPCDMPQASKGKGEVKGGGGGLGGGVLNLPSLYEEKVVFYDTYLQYSYKTTTMFSDCSLMGREEGGMQG